MSQNLEPQPLSDDFGDYARAPTTRETADHAELAGLAEAAVSCAKPGEEPWFEEWQFPHLEKAERQFIAAVSPAVCSALLSEIAALKGERDGLKRAEAVAVHAADTMADRATQAERQRDELRKALEPFAEAAENLDDETRDHDHVWEQPAAMSIDAGHLRTARALIANQGADQ